MSQIKFRVWNEETQSFLFPNGQTDQKTGICSFELCMGCVKLKNFESTTIELFSGLFDVDGNDIYEGDILTLPPIGSMKEVFTLDTILDWNDYDDSPREYFKKLKVIGHIHQYQYLLK